jgi:hypothetical protein
VAKPKYSREDLKKACLALNAAEASRVLVDAVAPDEAHAEACLEIFRRCGCAVVGRPSKKEMADRDLLAERIGSYLASFPPCVAKFDSHMESARLVEASFHDILGTLETFDISKCPPDRRAWACIKIAVSELNESVRIHEAQQKATPITMLKHLSIEAENGRTISLDSVVWNITRGLGRNLQMLGYREKWFDKATEELVIPSPVAVDDATAEQAGMLFIMELAWSDLVTGWDRIRLFEDTVKRERRALIFDNRPDPVEVELLEFGPPTKWELYDAVAVSRLQQNLFQHLMDLKVFAEGEIKSLDDGPVALPEPGSFISEGELIAFHFFEEVLFLPIRENRDHAGGISLKHWLRGYAFLAELCRDSGKSALDAKLVAPTDITTGLCRGGFTETEAALFIRHVTFGRKARDLMDDPLVRVADGRFMMFAPGWRSPMLTTVVMSRLGRFQTNFSDKGQRFEKAVRTQFADAGIAAKTFKYSIGDTQYDCDVAALWGRTLFVFECKNHALAFGHLPSLANFHHEFFYAAEQAARTKEFLELNPNVVKEHFGAGVKWDRVVACVLYATPWSIGRIIEGHELYSYDASALAKFLGDGRIAVQTPRRHKNITVLRRHQHTLWKGAKPDDDDLLHQLADPIQLKMERAPRKVEALFRETAPLKGLALPVWKLVSTSPEETLLAMGISQDEVAEIVKSFGEFHAAADEFDRRQADK